METGNLAVPRILQLPRIHDPRGNLTFAQGGAQLPFDLKRAYWIYDVPAGEERGGHSHDRTKLSSERLHPAADSDRYRYRYRHPQPNNGWSLGTLTEE